MKIDIICPLYNAEEYLYELDESLKKQNDVNIENIKYILTKSKDNTEQILKNISAQYFIVEPKDFSHSLTREKIAMQSKADVLVFITQDIVIKDSKWLYELVKPIINGEAEATFSRQLTKYDNIEKYTREKNYPEKSYIVSKEDAEKMGLRTFFFSDASSAIKTTVFKELKGYDNKDLPISEDMYIAYKIINGGYRIKYCANSVIYHSHHFSLKQLYKRYYDTGVFFAQNSYLDKFGTNKTGGGLAIYIIKRAIEDRNYKVLLRFLPDMFVRFLGMKVGKINGKKKIVANT